MISDTMGSSIHDISTVPELGDWGLGTIDTFDDIDINMENMEMINDSNDDPFGDFTLEQSFNLIELNNLQDVFHRGNNIDISCDSDPSSLLQDLDMRETLKQDCMWSAGINPSSGVNISSASAPCYTKLSLTPPTSYINQSLQMFETPLPSDDESSSSGSESVMKMYWPRKATRFFPGGVGASSGSSLTFFLRRRLPNFFFFVSSSAFSLAFF